MSVRKEQEREMMRRLSETASPETFKAFTESRAKQRKKKIFIIVAAFFTIFVILPAIVSGSNPSDARIVNGKVMPSDSQAQMVAQVFVRQELKSPRSADFSFDCNVKLNNNTYTVTGYVDAQNSFGGMMREYYCCEITYKGGDENDMQNWRVRSVVFSE